MKLVPKELLRVVFPGAKTPWGIPLLKLCLRMYLNFPMIYYSQEGRINDIDEDEDITLISVQDDTDAEMFDVNTLTGEEVVVVEEINERRDVVDEVADVIKTAQVST
ncbi:hypothetical protein Tco_1480678, partial [Tanacetum coccineum]